MYNLFGFGSFKNFSDNSAKIVKISISIEISEKMALKFGTHTSNLNIPLDILESGKTS